MGLDDQAALHAEAWHRPNPNRDIPAGAPPEGYSQSAGLHVGDMWSSGGDMPGIMTPDLQGPARALTFEDRPPSAPSTANAEDIFANVYHPRR